MNSGAGARVDPRLGVSRVFQATFVLALAAFAAALHIGLRAATGRGSIEVLATWWRDDNGFAWVLPFWLAVLLAWAAVLAALVRSLFAAVTGCALDFIFLGDRLDEGFCVAAETSASRAVRFVPRLAALPGPPSGMPEGRIYSRIRLLEDAEGNLTPAATLDVRSMVRLSLVHGALLAVAALPPVAMAVLSGDRLRGATAEPSAAAGWVGWSVAALGVFGVAFAANALAIRIARRRVGSDAPHVRLLELPASRTRARSRLSGTVVAQDLRHVSAGPNSRHTKVWRRYAVRFDSPDFPLPIVETWQARCDADARSGRGDPASGRGRGRGRGCDEAVFARLDAALSDGSPVEFEVTDDLAIAPHLPGLDHGARGSDDA